MSKHETPMTRWYWEQVGGTLIEEFCAVRRTKSCGGRWLDGVIIKGGEFRVVSGREFPSSGLAIAGNDIILVQTKAKRLGMYVMGQAFFSVELMKPFSPRSIETVALVGQDDHVLRPICERHGIRVQVCEATSLDTNT